MTGNVNKTVRVVTVLPDIRQGQLKFLSISCLSIFNFNIANAGLISFVQIKVGVMRAGPRGCLNLRVQRGKTLRVDVPMHMTAVQVRELSTQKHKAVDRNLRCGP